MEEKVLNMLVTITEEEDIRENLDMNLFDAGLLDSLGFTELIVAMEEQFGIEVSPTEVKREMLDTPNKIIEFVKVNKQNM